MGDITFHYYKIGIRGQPFLPFYICQWMQTGSGETVIGLECALFMLYCPPRPMINQNDKHKAKDYGSIPGPSLIGKKQEVIHFISVWICFSLIFRRCIAFLRGYSNTTFAFNLSSVLLFTINQNQFGFSKRWTSLKIMYVTFENILFYMVCYVWPNK